MKDAPRCGQDGGIDRATGERLICKLATGHDGRHDDGAVSLVDETMTPERKCVYCGDAAVIVESCVLCYFDAADRGETATHDPALRATMTRLATERTELGTRLADALLYLDDMAHEVELARQNLTRRGGQHVPYFGDYCNVGPNALSRIEYNVRELRRRLGENHER